MKRKLWIILLVFVASLSFTMAHDEGTSSQSEPTQPVADNAENLDDAGTTEDTHDAQGSDTPSLFMFNLGSRTLMILLISGVLAIGVTGAMWMITGRNLPNSIMIASLLAVFTGAIHLAFGIRGDYLLLANGIGFLGFAMIRSLNVIRTSQFNKAIVLALMVYTAITFVGYFLTHDHFDTLGTASKLTEAILFTVLLRDLFMSNRVEDATVSTATSPVIN